MLLLSSADSSNLVVVFFEKGTLSESQTVWIQSVGPDLDPNCLQRLSADDKSHC